MFTGHYAANTFSTVHYALLHTVLYWTYCFAEQCTLLQTVLYLTLPDILPNMFYWTSTSARHALLNITPHKIQVYCILCSTTYCALLDILLCWAMYFTTKCTLPDILLNMFYWISTSARHALLDITPHKIRVYCILCSTIYCALLDMLLCWAMYSTTNCALPDILPNMFYWTSTSARHALLDTTPHKIRVYCILCSTIYCALLDIMLCWNFTLIQIVLYLTFYRI